MKDLDYSQATPQDQTNLQIIKETIEVIEAKLVELEARIVALEP